MICNVFSGIKYWGLIFYVMSQGIQMMIEAKGLWTEFTYPIIK